MLHDVSATIDAVLHVVEAHANVVKRATEAFITTSIHRSPDLDIEAPAGAVLRTADELPGVVCKWSRSDSDILDAVTDAAVAAARDRADRDADELIVKLEAAAVLPPRGELRAAFNRKEIRP